MIKIYNPSLEHEDTSILSKFNSRWHTVFLVIMKWFTSTNEIIFLLSDLVIQNSETWISFKLDTNFFNTQEIAFIIENKWLFICILLIILSSIRCNQNNFGHLQLLLQILHTSSTCTLEDVFYQISYFMAIFKDNFYACNCNI